MHIEILEMAGRSDQIAILIESDRDREKVEYKNPEKGLFKNLVFEFLFDFFSKNQLIGVKSVQEYNFYLS
jgi:hypothetical protein